MPKPSEPLYYNFRLTPSWDSIRKAALLIELVLLVVIAIGVWR